jgi:beta-lactam-binding protein with PASTA domain
MPQVWNLPMEEAEAALHAASIPYRISRAQSQVVPEGDLVSVAPMPGTVMRPGDEVLLTVSCGAPVVPGDR